ncbi:AraC family transcriptional regulator [Gallaecimonas sp. GXIMD4217]|uniref:AraC family transcriptional regulator n=1 Tax=Gallaecimonas sp. GXIMD4217 TaxID=3131927 RepID=UPI00311AD2A3
MMELKTRFAEQIGSPWFMSELFERLPDLAFSIKDRQGRYVAVSRSLLARCDLDSPRDAEGRTAAELWPPHMAERYDSQDRELFATGQAIIDNLDLTLYPGKEPGWCLTNKVPIQGRDGQVIGLACLSRDLPEVSRAGLVDERMAATIDHIHHHLGEPLRVEELAAMAGLSAAQFDRRLRKIFHLSAGQYVLKARINAATRLLAGTELSVAEVALATGFCDQSALTRQFGQITGFTPRKYRDGVRAGSIPHPGLQP